MKWLKKSRTQNNIYHFYYLIKIPPRRSSIFTKSTIIIARGGRTTAISFRDINWLREILSRGVLGRSALQVKRGSIILWTWGVHFLLFLKTLSPQTCRWWRIPDKSSVWRSLWWFLGWSVWPSQDISVCRYTAVPKSGKLLLFEGCRRNYNTLHVSI